MTEYSSPNMVPEEPWEADIASLLSRLTPVDPPKGFIEQALDHRPLFALRALGGLGAICLAVLGVTYALGTFGQPSVIPEISTLTAQHSLASAGLFPSETDTQGDDGSFKVAPGEHEDDVVVTAPGMDLLAILTAGEDLRQSVYEHDSEAISIFSQPGRVDLDELPEGQRTVIDGTPAWVNSSNDVVVLAADNSVVIVMGLAPPDVARAIEEIPGWSRPHGVTSAVNSLTRELGFPDLD